MNGLVDTSRRSKGLLFHQMQVGGIELAGLLQALPVQHLQGATVQGDQAVAPEILQDPIDMHRREPERIAQLRLGHRQREGMVLHQLDRPQAHQQLARMCRKLFVSEFPL
jgi:hypothetical protein